MKRFFALLLAVFMLTGLMPVSAAASSEDSPAYTPETSTEVDVDSRYDYRAIFDLDNTRYDGRIWTDKTVAAGDLTYTGNVREVEDEVISDHSGAVTVKLDEGEDFLVSYSALASTTSVLSETASPIDLVLVLDMSPMSNSKDGKLASMLSAVESAAESIMGLNENNRVAVVAFSSQAKVLLPLGRYKSVDMSSSGQTGLTTTVTCTYLEEGKTQTGTETFVVSYQNGTPVNKYTQMGVYTGMKVLLENDDTTVQVGATTVTRQPALILMSEGEPKIASTVIDNPTQSTVQANGDIYVTEDEIAAGLSKTYRANSVFVDRVEIKRNEGVADHGSDIDGHNNHRRHAQTFATLLTAAYMKKAVAGHYGLTGDEKMQVYTIGINPTSANSPELAAVVLDPKTELASNADFAGYVQSFCGENGSVTLLNGGGGNNHTSTTLTNKFNLTADELRYNDGYYTVTGSGDDINWSGIFDLVIAQVTSNTAKVPTLVESTDVTGDSSGWLNYADPLGEYMELKSVKALIINDVIYRGCRSEVRSGRIYYVFSGQATNPVYGTNDLSDIDIYVETVNGRQTLHVDIPAALLPLRQTTVTENVEGQVTGFTHNSAYPFRLVYSVGLQEGVVTEGHVNLKMVSEEYIAGHTVNGLVQFYEGMYDPDSSSQPGDVGLDEKTIGNAYVSYTPALDNPFYYVDEDTPLYTNEACTVPAAKYDEGQTYYFKATYYRAVNDGDSVDSDIKAVEATEVVMRPSSTIPEDSTEVKDGKLYLSEGQPRLGNLADFRREKGGNNNTGTADIYLYLYHVDETEGIEGAHDFKIFHGNNGRLGLPLPDGTLSVTKTAENVSAEQIAKEIPDGFTFEITLPDNPNVDGVEWNETTNTGTFTLDPDETKTFSLEPGTAWSVTETTEYPAEEESHWTNTLSVDNEAEDGLSASGTMAAGDTAALVFHSKHETHTGTLTISKETNDEASQSSTTSFSFTLTCKEPDKTKQTVKTFTLTSGNSRTFTLPAGTSWTVTEGALSENWATEITVDGEAVTTASGEIDDGGAHRAVFTNNYTAPGTLTVSKLVEGGQSGEYTFSITFNGDETENFTLNKANRYTAVFEKTPGTTWTVEETSALDTGWTVSVNGQAGDTASGEFESGVTSAVTFTNSAPGSLTVKKTAEGSDETFSFTLSYGGTTESFELADGESKNFTGLPAGTEYTVTENSGEGWRAEVGGLETNTVSGRITAGAETTLEFVNTPVEPRLTVAKTASAESLEAGETVDFTITVTNAGEGPLSDITLTDLFEGGAGELVFADLPAGVIRNDDGSFAIAGLAPGESVEIKSAYTALEEDEGKTLTNSAAAKSSGGASGEDKVSVEVEDGGIYVPPSDKPGHETPAENAVPPMLNGEDHFAYVIGYDDGTVRPEGQITRAEVATIIFRLLDPEVRDENLTAENGFEDVGEDDWYNTAVSTLVKLGIISGRSDTSFDPDAPITRAEFATLFARFDESGTEPAGGFSDLSGHWARESVERAAALGWIDGYEDGSFRPDNRITRAEAMTMVNRVLNRNPVEEEDLLPDMRVWSDNRPGSWYYFAVQEATNSHEYTRPDSHEDWTKLTEDPDWDRYQ